MTDLQALLDEATPGPWGRKWGDVFPQSEPDDLIATLYEGSEDANARLIAMAPDLAKRVLELEARDREAATHIETRIAMRTHFTGDPPYVGWSGLGVAMVEKFDKDEARIAELEAALEQQQSLTDEVKARWAKERAAVMGKAPKGGQS